MDASDHFDIGRNIFGVLNFSSPKAKFYLVNTIGYTFTGINTNYQKCSRGADRIYKIFIRDGVKEKSGQQMLAFC